MPGDNVMEMPVVLVLLQLLLIEVVGSVNPGCQCLQFTSSYGKEYGVFTSPDYPRPYHDNINCLLYTFIASRDEIIEITFKDFDVQKSHLDCIRGDFLKLFLHLDKPDVNELTSWSGLLCGGVTDIPHVIYSSGPVIVLEFHSDAKASNSSGFIGNFRFIDRRMFQTDGQKLPGTMCDHQFISSNYSLTQGRFYSPRYPSSYPKNIRCAYRFRGRGRERLRIVFEEVTLQKGDLSCLNRADVVKVHDGRSSLYPTISVICNEGSELEVLSTGSDLYIEFVANSEWPGQGFKATFQFQPLDAAVTGTESDRLTSSLGGTNQKQADNGPAVSATTSQSTAVIGVTTPIPIPIVLELKPLSRVLLCPNKPASSCDAVFNSDVFKNGSVSSPGFPNPYPSRSYCRYDFQGRGKERVQIVFTDFNLYHPTDNPKECESIDALVANVHLDGRMEKIDSFCGSAIPKPLMSNGPRLMLEFRGIYSSRYSRGFRATYSFTENFGIKTGRQDPDYPCAFVFNSTETMNGTFASPNFPGLYPRDTECHYYFHGKKNERVRLHFTYFDVEGVLPCEAISASDYVEFSNFKTRDRKYSRYCGQLKEFGIDSDRKFFRVTFRSNDRLDGSGFKANYMFVDEMESYTANAPSHKNDAVTAGSSLVSLVFLAGLVLLAATKNNKV